MKSTDLERLRDALAASGDLAYEWDTGSDRIAWLQDASAQNGHAFVTDVSVGEDFNGLVYPDDLPGRLEGSIHLAHSFQGPRLTEPIR